MTFVDTSVWVDAFRGRNAALSERLRALLDAREVALAAPVRVELLSGASRRSLATLRRVLSALPVYYPTETTWALLEVWVDRAVGAGQRFGVGDLLIGAIAAENGGAVWSFDADFARLARLGLVRTHRARGD